jgi:hypothetical protein
LGVGFAFVGSQYRLTIGNEDFFIDLLFYHLKLRAFVVVDLKMKAFEPEFAGKMNFYLSAVNDLLRHPDDQPSIGIILCKTRDRFIAEYALRDINKPIGISEYRLAESLPEKLKGSLPTIEELESEFRSCLCGRVRLNIEDEPIRWFCKTMPSCEFSEAHPTAVAGDRITDPGWPLRTPTSRESGYKSRYRVEA